MNKILFLDLDGTVRETKSGKTFINQPDDQQLINGVTEVIRKYSNWIKIGITNQGGVASGHKSIESAILEQKITLQLLPELEWIYFCPSYDGLECWKVDHENSLSIKQRSVDEFDSFRKPGAGMIKLAFHHFEFENITEFLYVGDRPEDEQAAAAANIPFMWAHDWRQT